MSGTVRNTLLARLVTPGGDDPLILSLVAPSYIPNGSPVSGIRLAGKGGAGGYVYSIITGSLPTGLSLDGSTGAITGTPSAVGVFAFVAQVQDSSASVYTASFSLTIASRLLIDKPLPGPGEVDLAYLGRFRVVGATGTVTWTLESGNLPAGLSMDSAGLITGTPTGDSSGLGGISYFTVKATDSGTGDTLDVPHKIRVYDELTADFPARVGPTIVPIGVANMPAAIAGVANTYPITIIGGAPPYRVTAYPLIYPGLKVGYVANDVSVRVRPSMADVGGFIVYRADIIDALGATTFLYFSQEVIEGQALQAQENGASVGPRGPSIISFDDGTNTTVEVDDLGGGAIRVRVNAPGGGGGGGVSSVGGATPDSSGNIDVVSPDGSVGIVVDSSGALALTSTGAGGIQTINGAGPDSSGDLQIDGIEVDIAGVRVSRSPTANFSNNGIALTGTLTVEIPRMPYAGTIVGWTIVGDASGDVDITVSHADYASFPTVTTLFTATCTGAQKEEGSGLSHAFSEGDVLRFSATDFANFTRCSISLVIQ